MTKFIILVAALAVLAFQAQAAPQATKVIDCAKVVDFSTLDKKCCVKPISDLGLAATIEKCNPKNKNKDASKWLNDYMLYKLQSVKLNNAIDLKSANNLKLVCSIATANGTIDSTVVKTLMSNNMKDADWKTMLEGIATGVEYKDYIPPMFSSGISCPTSTKKGAPTTNVSVEAFILVQYLQLTIITLCPEFTESTTKNKCDSQMESFYACQGMMMNTMFPESKVAQFSQSDSVYKNWLANPKQAANTFKQQMLTKK